jgi:hypothetical protein
MVQFRSSATVFSPTEALCDLFAFALTDCVPRMAGGAAIDGTAAAVGGRPLRDMRRRAELPQFRHAGPLVVRFIQADGDPVVTRATADQMQGRVTSVDDVGGSRTHSGAHELQGYGTAVPASVWAYFGRLARMETADRRRERRAAARAKYASRRRANRTNRLNSV